jgi:hypothetical protein
VLSLGEVKRERRKFRPRDRFKPEKEIRSAVSSSGLEFQKSKKRKISHGINNHVTGKKFVKEFDTLKKANKFFPKRKTLLN